MSAKIPYHEFGGQGPVIHFAHANAYPPACYRQMMAHLALEFRVIGVHHRPLWPQSRPDAMSDWHVIGDDMIRFLDQNDLSCVIGMGHSLGGVATMYAALKRPDLFSKLVLIEPVFYTPAALEAIRVNPELAEQTPLVKSARRRRSRWSDRDTAFHHFRKKSVFERWPDESLWDYVNHGLHQNGSDEFELVFPREWEARIYKTIPTDVWENIPSITHQTLAVRGSQSDTLLAPNWELWQQLQPSAKYVEVDGVGHMLLMEKPALAADIVLDFLKEAVGK